MTIQWRPPLMDPIPVDEQDDDDGGGAGNDEPATITGARDFTSTAAYVGDYIDIIGEAPNSGIRYSVDEAAHGDLFLVGHDTFDSEAVGSATLTIEEVDYAGSGPDDLPTTTFRVVLPTVGASGDPADLIPTTAADLIDAFNNSTAADRVTATLLAGHDGTGDVSLVGVAAINGPGGTGAITPHVEIVEGVVTSPVTIHPDLKHETPLTLRTALGSVLGTAVINVEHYDGSDNDANGYGVAHIDSDGGGGFASGRFAWDQGGSVRIAVAVGVATPFLVSRDTLALVSAGDTYAVLLVTSDGADTRCIALNTATGQTVDAIELYSADDNAMTFRVTPAGEVHADGGVVLKSPNGTAYRLVVANDGTLSTEAV